MDKFFVAKSYQGLPIEVEPYEISGRMYVKVRTKNGSLKQVRAYTQVEYERLYGATAITPVTESNKSVKQVLGFQEGYIWIFKGDLEAAEYWFSRTPECRYAVSWGWYIVSTDSIPFDIPSCITAVKLPWEKIGNSDGTLLPKSKIEEAVNALRFDAHPSAFQGAIGERLTLSLTFLEIREMNATQYGPQYLYRFEDADRNQYSWFTGTRKAWNTGDIITCGAGVKAHEVVKGINTTVLTRLIEKKG